MENSRSILMTGATGFIGRHVLGSLYAGSKIYALKSSLSDRLLTGFPGIEIVPLDESKEIEKLSHIVHWAGAIKGSKKHLYNINVTLTRKLLKPNIKVNAHFVYVSSINTQVKYHSVNEGTKIEAERLVFGGKVLYHDYKAVICILQDPGPNLKLFTKLILILKVMRVFPVLPITCKLQPVDVSDIVRCITCMVLNANTETQLLKQLALSRSMFGR